jgi:hypothetical protein
MTSITRHVAEIVLAPFEVDPFILLRVTGETDIRTLLARHRGETPDLRHIASRFHVCSTGAVAAFTTLLFRFVARLRQGYGMRGLQKLLVDLLVTGGANVRTDVLRRVARNMSRY